MDPITSLSFGMYLLSPAAASVVSPLSTLAYYVMDGYGASSANAAKKTARALGILSSSGSPASILTLDPLATLSTTPADKVAGSIVTYDTIMGSLVRASYGLGGAL